MAALMNPLHQTNTHVSVRGHFSESALQYGNKLKVVISLMGVITTCNPERLGKVSLTKTLNFRKLHV